MHLNKDKYFKAMNKLKSLYSQFIMNIAENKFSDADNTLEEILTEKIKKKVQRAIKKKTECGCTKSCHNEAKTVNPWAVCTSSVGREDKNKYEKCVKGVKKGKKSKKK